MNGRMESQVKARGTATGRLGTLVLLLGLVQPLLGQDGPRPDLKRYVDFAMQHAGSVERGKALYNTPQKVMCATCHSLDGATIKMGPSLEFTGDNFRRSDLIEAILQPSATIAIGYATTMVTTKAGRMIMGTLTGATDEYVELVGIDGKPQRIPKGEIATQRNTNRSLMPEGLQASLSPEEFTDLVEYLSSLKQSESGMKDIQGMPATIQALAKPVVLRPFFSEDLRFPHSVADGKGSVRAGLTWFGQLPGEPMKFLVVHQSGRIWLLDKSGETDRKTMFADLSADTFSERGPNGLLGIAFHPRFRENRRYYLYRQFLENGEIVCSVIEREATDDFLRDSGKPSRLVWTMPTTTQDHTGGGIAFGPDGYLYIGPGDTGPQGDTQGHGQNLAVHQGKMLRIDVDNRDPGLSYAIPADNPFVGRADVRPEIWAWGLREPWRFSFDPETGDLWVGDVGQDRVEEVDILRSGENYGWNVREGFDGFSEKYRTAGASYSPPIFAYGRKYGNSVTGGYVYRGDKDSSFDGVYICGDFNSKLIWGLKQHDRKLDVVREIGTCPDRIVSFASDDKGALYVVGYEGMIYQLDLSESEFR